MTAPSWSTIVHVRIMRAGEAAAEAVWTAVTRVFDTTVSPGDTPGAARSPITAGTFSVNTAARHFPGDPAPLASPGSGPVAVALFGDIDAVDRVVAVLSSEYVTHQLADNRATVALTVHPDARP